MVTYTGLPYGNTSTLAGLREDIYYLGKINNSSIDSKDLNRIINKYYAQVQEVIRSVNENFYMVVATSDLTSQDQSFTFPDGTGTAPAYEKLKAIYISTSPVDPTAPLDSEYEKVNVVDPTQISDPSYQFTEPTAIMFGTYFTIPTMAQSAVSYPITDGVRVYYIATQDKLTNDTDSPKIFPSFHDAIVQGSLIDIAQRFGNDKLKIDSVALFSKRLSEIKSYASDRLPQGIGLVEGQENAGGWEYPWNGNHNSI